MAEVYPFGLVPVKRPFGMEGRFKLLEHFELVA